MALPGCRVPLPVVNKKIETGKVLLKTVRADSKSEIDAQKSMGGVSEDDIDRDLEALEKEFKKGSDQLDELADRKEKELMTI